MKFDSQVEICRQDLRQVHALRKQLAGRQGGEGAMVAQVEFEVDSVRPGKSFLRVQGDRVPYPGVGHVDGAEEVGRGRGLDLPEERPGHFWRWAAAAVVAGLVGGGVLGWVGWIVLQFYLESKGLIFRLFILHVFIGG